MGNVKVHVETFQQVFEETFCYEKRYSGYQTFVSFQTLLRPFKIQTLKPDSFEFKKKILF